MSLQISMKKFIDNLINRYPLLISSREDIEKAAILLVKRTEKGGKYLICGNGGSCADADHIVGELMKGFLNPRTLTQEQKNSLISAGGDTGRKLGNLLQQAIPAVSLCSSNALNTAFMNDVDPALVFAQQIMGLGLQGDVFWGISTSGNSQNVVSAAITSKAFGLSTFAMTGEKESRLSALCDVCIRVPAIETYQIQELHLPIYHSLCMIIEDYFFVNAK